MHSCGLPDTKCTFYVDKLQLSPVNGYPLVLNGKRELKMWQDGVVNLKEICSSSSEGVRHIVLQVKYDKMATNVQYIGIKCKNNHLSWCQCHFFLLSGHLSENNST